MKVFFGILLCLAGIILAGLGLWIIAIFPVAFGCYLMLSYEKDIIENYLSGED